MTVSDTSLDDAFDWDFNKYYQQESSLIAFAKQVDPLSPLQKSFADRVQLITKQNQVSSFLVDSRIVISGPSDSLRADAIQNWEKQKVEGEFWGRLYLVTAITSFAGSAAAAVTFTPAVMVAGLVAGSVAVYFANQHYSHVQEAKSQIEQWNEHPALRVADKRAKAFKQGFFYCLQHSLKGSYGTLSKDNILHPNEVTWLYEKLLGDTLKAVSAYAQRHNISPVEKTNWVEQFIEQNPLSSRAIEYAYPPDDPKKGILDSWAAAFVAYQQDVVAAQKQFSNKSIEAHAHSKKELGKIEEQRKLALAHPAATQKANDDEAFRIYKSRIDAEGVSEQDRTQALNDYRKSIENNKNAYQKAVQPINAYYDQCKKDIESTRVDHYKRIEEERAQGIARYFEAGLKLFSDAYEEWGRQKREEESMNANHFANSSGKSVPIPSAPAWNE